MTSGEHIRWLRREARHSQTRVLVVLAVVVVVGVVSLSSRRRCRGARRALVEPTSTSS